MHMYIVYIKYINIYIDFSVEYFQSHEYVISHIECYVLKNPMCLCVVWTTELLEAWWSYLTRL